MFRNFHSLVVNSGPASGFGLNLDVGFKAVDVIWRSDLSLTSSNAAPISPELRTVDTSEKSKSGDVGRA